MPKKRLIFIGGTMGIGKTTLGKYLVKHQLENAVFLDGDWCWDMDPWKFTPENKKMVMKNIRFLLNSFLENSYFKNVVFVWVMHEQTIIDDILSGLDGDYDFYSFSLISKETELKKRFAKDVEQGVRDENDLGAAVARISLYQKVDSIKIDVTDTNYEANAAKILSCLDD